MYRYSIPTGPTGSQLPCAYLEVKWPDGIADQLSEAIFIPDWNNETEGNHYYSTQRCGEVKSGNRSYEAEQQRFMNASDNEEKGLSSEGL
jgi:hypothetical protein